jgi:hypothetical protein
VGAFRRARCTHDGLAARRGPGIKLASARTREIKIATPSRTR